MTFARRGRPAFTLLEVILVMAIIIVMMAVAVPTLDGLRGDTYLRGASDEVREAWANARSQSIEDGIPYQFSVQQGTTKYKVSPDSSQSSGSGGSTSANTSNNGTVQKTAYVSEGELPNGILFNPPSGATDGSGWCVVVTFLPDGTVKPYDNSTEDPHIDLNEAGSHVILTVSVRPLTGTVSIKSNKQNK